MAVPARPRVLVADDQSLLRWAIGRAVGALGAEVVFAGTYHQACDLLAGGDFAAVIIACPFEGRSIVGLLRDLDRSRPDTRLLVLCCNESPERVQDNVPRARVMQKPVAMEELAAAVAPILGAAAV